MIDCEPVWLDKIQIPPNYVAIPLDDYASMLDTDTRVEVLVDYLASKGCASIDEIVTILGCKADYERRRNKYNEGRIKEDGVD